MKKPYGKDYIKGAKRAIEEEVADRFEKWMSEQPGKIKVAKFELKRGPGVMGPQSLTIDRTRISKGDSVTFGNRTIVLTDFALFTHNQARAYAIIAHRGEPAGEIGLKIYGVTRWGNLSKSQYPEPEDSTRRFCRQVGRMMNSLKKRGFVQQRYDEGRKRFVWERTK